MTVTIEDQFIGKRLRERRVLLGVSQSRLGGLERLTFQQIQKYETGRNRIAAGRLWRFSKILHVHIFYFFDGLETIINEHERNGGVDVSDNTKLRYLDARTNKLEIEINRLNKSFLKIKDVKLRKSVVELAKGLAESETKNQKPEVRNKNINKK
jgi:transcriptional regulator with XRE-family HTH domain